MTLVALDIADTNRRWGFPRAGFSEEPPPIDTPLLDVAAEAGRQKIFTCIGARRRAARHYGAPYHFALVVAMSYHAAALIKRSYNACL